MKRFMETNVITHNLMSFSGFKALLIFSLLTQYPKSYNEIKQEIENNEYLKETISIDTIRIYMNSLKSLGCNIQKIKKNRQVKYFINSNPFELKITDKQAKSIIKVYKAISKSIEISDFLILQQLFNKIAPYIKNEKLKEQLRGISPVSHIHKDMIDDLMKYINSKTQITVLYNSKNSGQKEINIIPDRLNIRNGKLYLSGNCIEHKNYSAFLVSDIKKIIGVSLNSKEIASQELIVKYKYLKKDNLELELLENERIVEQKNNSTIVEIVSENKFMITQRILSLSNRCRVISPENYKNGIIAKLKQMKENYIE